MESHVNPIQKMFTSISREQRTKATKLLTTTTIWRSDRWFPLTRATNAQSVSRSDHYDDVMMSAIASQITSLAIVYSIFNSDEDQRTHQGSASPAFVRGIHRRPVNSPHKWPVTRKIFPFDDVIMCHHVMDDIDHHSFTKQTKYWYSNNLLAYIQYVHIYI